MMKVNLSLALGLLVFGSQAAFGQISTVEQNPGSHRVFCATEAPDQQWEEHFQRLINEAKKTGNKSQSVPYTIPVIIHVIHGGQPVGTYPNLAQGQLNSQIQVLNEDFGGIGYNSGNYPSTAFSSYAINEVLAPPSVDGLGRVKIENCNVQFCLATKDSLGNILAEPGIERINYVSKGWSNPASFSTTNGLRTFINNTVKPQTIWNVSKYLNIWVTDNDINGNSLLGYATFPYLSQLQGITTTGSATTDGYWCFAKAFGSKTIFPSGIYYNGYDRGRVSTHEIGHWLGLRHIGGDGNSNPSGDCSATDYCDDTPPQRGGYNTGTFGQNFGSPPYPLFATGGSSCPSAVNGCMFMNFMDYTDDGAKYMYSPDQGTRIQTAMGNSPYRKFLGSHNLCSVTSVASVSQFKAPATVCQLATVSLTNTSYGTPVPSYTWTSNGVINFLPDANSAGTVTFYTPGTFVITLTTDNGTVSVYSRTIVVTPSPSLVLSVPSGNVCKDEMFDIEATGGNTYLWQPGNVSGSTMGYDGSADQSFTCVATGPGGCKATVELELHVVDCTGIKDLKTEQTLFSVYPNPSHGLVNLKSRSASEKEVLVEILDVNGRQILEKACKFNPNTLEAQLNIEWLSRGVYILKLESDKSGTHFVKLVKE